MKIWVVYQWDRFDHTEYGRRYFLSQEKAMAYYEKSKERDPKGYWEWDEIEVED